MADDPGGTAALRWAWALRGQVDLLDDFQFARIDVQSGTPFTSLSSGWPRMVYEVSYTARRSLAAAQPRHLPLGKAIALLGFVALLCGLVNPFELANEDKWRLCASRFPGVGIRSFILCKRDEVVAIAILGRSASLRMQPHTVFKDFVVEIPRS
jgi:hypothetical protein